MRHGIITILCTFSCCCASFARSGNTAMPFLRTDFNPVTAAMAGAGSLHSISYASFGNSSVIPLSDKRFDATASYMCWAPDGLETTGYDAGIAGKVTEKIGISGGVYFGNGTTYEIIGENGRHEGTFRPSEFLVNAGFAYRINDNLSAGVNLHYAGQSLAKDANIKAFAGDLNVSYSHGGLRVSGGVKSLGSTVKSSSGDSYGLPASISAAAAYLIRAGEDHGILLALDGDCFLAGAFSAAAGVQYGFRDMLFVRAGAHMASKTAPIASHVALGCGVKFAGFHVDAAYLTANETIGNGFTVGIGYCF